MIRPGTAPEDLEQLAAQLLELLQRRRDRVRTGAQPRPLRALVIARWLNVRPLGTDDSRKRGVRLVVDHLRRSGQPVVANFHGYWLANTPDDFARYDSFLVRMGLRHLISARRIRLSEPAADASGQFSMAF